MKIIVVGATGTIGSAVVALLKENGNEVIPVSTQNNVINVDITDKKTIENLFSKLNNIDGIICAAGRAYAGPLSNMGNEEFNKGINSKMMGQINLAMIAKDHLNNNGFITLTSGNLSEEPKEGSAGLGLVNGAINGFVVNAALEMPRGIRLNAVSPSILLESTEKYGQSPGRLPVSAKDVASAYLQIATSNVNGEIVKVYGKKN
jgi:NAD(P)-dependent dehydrogenase (short-subunit alcohol dehydrogenase family)